MAKRSHTYWVVILVILISPIALIAQHSEPDFDKMEIRSSRHWLDIDYVGDNHIGHKLDIHLPQQKLDKYPIVVAIYGSAWFSNDKKAAIFSNPIGQTLLDAGYAVVTINHRSSNDAKFPAQIQDVKAAIRFVRAKAHLFDMDPSFIGITGWSSGGHLSALAGTSNHVDTFEYNGETMDIEGNLGNYTQTSSHVDAVVDWFGPTDFLLMDSCGSRIKHDGEKSPESSLVGGPIQTMKDACHFADPATYVSSDTPPFLIVHGDEDPLVPHCESEHLQTNLEQVNAESRLIIVKGGKHGPGVLIPEYLGEMTAFFNAHKN